MKLKNTRKLLIVVIVVVVGVGGFVYYGYQKKERLKNFSDGFYCALTGIERGFGDAVPNICLDYYNKSILDLDKQIKEQPNTEVGQKTKTYLIEQRVVMEKLRDYGATNIINGMWKNE